jgi:hypothetical protein
MNGYSRLARRVNNTLATRTGPAADAFRCGQRKAHVSGVRLRSRVTVCQNTAAITRGSRIVVDDTTSSQGAAFYAPGDGWIG